jgi:hypothetical protein
MRRIAALSAGCCSMAVGMKEQAVIIADWAGFSSVAKAYRPDSRAR